METSCSKIPTNPYIKRFSSLIRPIKIYLPKRRDDDKSGAYEYDNFVGRELLMERLFNWLSDKRNECGSYLVTGFRGMGKTKLVERVTGRLVREVTTKAEPLWLLLVLLPIIVAGVIVAIKPIVVDSLEEYECIAAIVMCVWTVSVILASWLNKAYYIRKKRRSRQKYPNRKKFNKTNVDRLAYGRNDDISTRSYHNIKVSVNLGHEVLRERDVLSLIAVSVKDKYTAFVKSNSPHLLLKSIQSLLLSLLCVFSIVIVIPSSDVKIILSVNSTSISYEENNINSRQVILSGSQENSSNQQVVVKGKTNESWLSRMTEKATSAAKYAYQDHNALGISFRFVLFLLLAIFYAWIFRKLCRWIPYLSTPLYALRRLDTLTERLNTITGEETGIAPTAQNSLFSFSLFSHRRHKTKPIADIREIETELSDIINMVNSERCLKDYRVRFIVVFDEMDKIDPAMMEQSEGTQMPEYTDAVKGFPEGMESRERRRNVLKLLANIKLFVSTARAKFVFISGRELYDAYLADLSDRDFAISSIFSGVINVDSFLTPEGGQSDVRSMSEWYISNCLIPREWLEEVEKRNAKGQLKDQSLGKDAKATLKREIPSLRWYYEYLVEECNTSVADATYVIGFLHTFAAYLTHISNGSPKKIYLYFDKHIRKDADCVPLNDWGDVLSIGIPDSLEDNTVLYFSPIQQKTINFVYYLANPIMGTITNDLSNYGDRFLVSLSFIIDHIYKHHNRSFSWRNMEQIPDLLKISKAPELRDSVMSIMEYLTQIHISPILIGLNEYKFHRSIAEEISYISKISDEASALFNFTLDESLSVIQYNTRLLNHYMELDKPDRENNGHRQYLPIVARIHSNLGDLHFWDEDYYAASLEYRAAVDAFSKDETVSGFLTRVRCMLKLGLTYESRKLFPNAYQLYCQLMELLIKKRWIDDSQLGLTTRDQYVDDWRGRRQVMVYKEPVYGIEYQTPTFKKQFYHEIVSLKDEARPSYSVNVDGVVSSFASDLTEEKTAIINSLTLFEEIRYVYQAILAKLSVLEKMGMSGITQTNITVAEGEFLAIHKSVNIKEKFIISADFFRKLAEILYFKNSLTILTQNQDSLYASVYYDDYDLLANLDDYVKYFVTPVNSFAVKHDVRLFFNLLDNPASTDGIHPVFYYVFPKDSCTYKELFERIMDNLRAYLDAIGDNGLLKPDDDYSRIKANVEGFLRYNIEVIKANDSLRFYHPSVEACDHHCRKMRENGLRPPCYACKYYTRSLRILADNMFEDKDILTEGPSKAYGILKKSFKRNLLYTRSNHIRILAQTLEGFGNVMLSCASGDNLERDGKSPKHGISSDLIAMLLELSEQSMERDEIRVIECHEKQLSKHPLSRLDKSILYYWDAYRFYLTDSCYNEAVSCLNKIINLLAYYIEVLCYYGGGECLRWDNEKEAEAVKLIIGDKHYDNSFVSILFRLVARYSGYKYDLTNLSEISELKQIYSKDVRDNIDLTRLSNYPAIRSAWLRIVEIRAKGLHFLEECYSLYKHEDYLDFIKQTYPLIAPQNRYETTFYEEVLGYYTKMRFNDHILNEILNGNPMLEKSSSGYAESYHILFYQKLADWIESTVKEESLENQMFETEGDVNKRLQLIEHLILDTLVCVTKMVKVFVPHNNISSYSNSFIGIVYNYYWEWAHKYEFLYSLYQYEELLRFDRQEDAEKIVRKMASGSSISIDDPDKIEVVSEDLRVQMRRCCKLLSRIEYTDDEEKYGTRSERLYEQLRHKVDDITLSNIYSNYTAEMALKYYQRAAETSTEGTAYKEMMGTMYFLDDDMNNDTNQFNIACDRFLLNCGVIDKQRRRLDALYRHSNVYHLRKAYIEGPNNLRDEDIKPNQFDRSQFINSEY